MSLLRFTERKKCKGFTLAALLIEKLWFLKCAVVAALFSINLSSIANMRRAVSLIRTARAIAPLIEQQFSMASCQIENLYQTLPASVSNAVHHNRAFANKSLFNIQRAEMSTAAPSPPSPPIPTDVIEINSPQTFNSAVALSNSIPVILQAHAQWCAPCKKLAPVLAQQVAAQSGKIALASMDIDVPALAPLVQQLQITSVPTLIMLYGGRAVDIKQGAPPPAELQKWILKSIELAEAVAGAAGAPRDGNAQPDGPVADPKTLVKDGFIAARSPGA